MLNGISKSKKFLKMIQNMVAKKCNIHSVSIAKQTFNSEEEILQWLYLHVPIAIKPKSKTAKTNLVPTFTSSNAFEQVCKELAKNLFNYYHVVGQTEQLVCNHPNERWKFDESGADMYCEECAKNE